MCLVKTVHGGECEALPRGHRATEKLSYGHATALPDSPLFGCILLIKDVAFLHKLTTKTS